MTEILSFGEWVRRRRRALDLTQDELASRAGCSKELIAKIEGDARRPSKQVAALLAVALDLAPAEHDLFVRAARAELAADRLPAPLDSVPQPLLLPRAAPAAAPVVPSGLPSGTVTFLFTDIVGSSRLWERHSDAMRAALDRHTALLRSAVDDNGGHIFKAVGDGLCAAFAEPARAFAAALFAQRALLSEPWDYLGLAEPLQVRMALHAGAVTPADGDYHGQPLNRVARLLAAGHGTQVLLSLAATELVRDHLPNDVTLRDLGRHRLKDLGHPEVIAQVVAPDLPSSFPPLRTLDAQPGNLPTQLNALIGRAQELAELGELLRGGTRLLTLTGPGGTGKTRLALQVAADAAEVFSDGAWFVDLSPVTDPMLVPATIVQALGIPEAPGLSPQDQLLRALGPQRQLLVLDNYEQVVVAAPLVAALLAAAPGVQVLVTSRVPLRVMGEREVPIAPLALPPERIVTIEQLTQYEAVRLFIERATAVQSAFVVTSGNAPAVAEVCMRLDGLPLAIELAAARVRLFTPEQLLARLQSARLQTLTGGRRDLPARQQTIRAAIDWSYQLLTPIEQALFVRLAVFVGGWTLEACEAIADDAEGNALDGLEALVAHSLVRRFEGSAGPRFIMLETIREYAVERLAEHGEGDALAQRHATYYADLAEVAEPELRSGAQLAWRRRLDDDNDNLRAALAWGFSAPRDGARHVITAFRTAAALWYYWHLHARFAEGLSWLDRLVGGEAGVPAALRASVFARAAWLHRASYSLQSVLAEQRALSALQVDGVEDTGESTVAANVVLVMNSLPAQRHADRAHLAVHLARAGRSPWWFAQALNAYASATASRDGDAAAVAFEQARQIAQQTGDRWLLTFVLLSRPRYARAADERAAAWLREGIALSREIGDWSGLCWACGMSGHFAMDRGEVAAARSYFEERLRVEQSIGNTPGIVMAMNALAEHAYRVGDLDRAEQLLDQSMVHAPPGHDQRSVLTLVTLARVCFDRGEYDRAVAIINRALEFAHAHHDRSRIGYALWSLGYFSLTHGAFTEAERCSRELRAIAQDLGEDAAYADHLEIEGMVHRYRGALDAARLSLRACIEVRESLEEQLNVTWARLQLAWVELAAGNIGRAAPLFIACVRVHQATPFAADVPPLLEGVAALAQEQRSLRQAARFWGAVAALRTRFAMPMWPIDVRDHEARVAATRALLGDAAFDDAWKAGHTMTWEQAADEALVWLEACPEVAP